MTEQLTPSVSSAFSCGESSTNPVALFVATRWELAAVRRALPIERRVVIDGVGCLVGQQAGRSYCVVRTGIGPEAATIAATAVLNRQPMALVISIGFVGALVPAAIGDIIIGTSVASGVLNGRWKEIAEPISCDAAAISAVRAVASQMAMTARTGSIVSLSTVVCRASEKHMIGRLTGAVALDMESAAVGSVAKQQEIPFLIVRTVSDLVDEDLPLDFNLFLRPSSRLKGILSLMSHPTSLLGLERLRRQSRLAGEHLASICSAFAGAGFGL